MIHVDHYTIDVGDKTEIFMSVEYGFFFLRVFHKLKPPLPQNEMLLISKKNTHKPYGIHEVIIRSP